ncbi:MAG: type II toxin-antitoxin system VapC family toxin [Anaerolineae bacterium]|nr:type II toxin-antitoxin system VapC family toxin [Anaerolineae bacterium]
MANYFIDSSALVKRYTLEIGTSWVRNITAPRSGHTIMIAQITLVEMISALARQYHDGKATLNMLQTFRRQVEYHARTQYTLTGLNRQIIAGALSLHERYRLRAYDSVQLATAVELHKRAVSIAQIVIFIASDARLLQAAVGEGLNTDNPNDHA